jgi:hypothetical protein
MPNYESMYFKLAARVADVVEILIAAQQEGEESYVDDKNAMLMLEKSDDKQEE